MLLEYLVTRQVITEILFVYDMAFVIILIRYVTVGRKRFGDQYWRTPSIWGAYYLLYHFVGVGITRAWSSFLYYGWLKGWDVFKLENQYPLAIAGTALSVIGMCGIIWVFSPDAWRHKAWIATCVVALAFVLFMRWLS